MPRRPGRTAHLRDTRITIGCVALSNQGIHLHCQNCGHHGHWTAAELAAIEPPWRLLWGFKVRRRCSKCGAPGSTEAIHLTISNGYSGASPYRSADPAAPQLWAAWARLEGTPPQRYAQ